MFFEGDSTLPQVCFKGETLLPVSDLLRRLSQATDGRYALWAAGIGSSHIEFENNAAVDLVLKSRNTDASFHAVILAVKEGPISQSIKTKSLPILLDVFLLSRTF